MPQPYFSIIIPNYNQGNYLKKNLEITTAQSFKNYEVIIIDNFSTDNTLEVIKKFKKKIKFFQKKNNGIIAKSRNLGIKKSKGKWLAFLDADDYWTKNKLKIIFNYINNFKFDVICNNEWKIIDNKKIKILKNGPYSKNFYKNLLINGNCMSTSASIIKKDFLIKNKIFFDERKSFVTAEDYDFFLRIAFSKGVFFFTKKVLGFHTFHNKSASYNLIMHFNSIYKVLKYHCFYIQKFKKNKFKLFNNLKAKNNLKLNLALFFNKKLSFFLFSYIVLKNLFFNPKITFKFLFINFFKYIDQFF